MLRSIQSLKHSVVLATDGEIGKIESFLFDDEKWSIRYLVVKTAWLVGRKVLISPLAIKEMNGELHFIRLSLTRKQVELSPDIDTDKPVSRQMETQFHDYYRWPYYWEGSGVWGIAAFPAGMLGRPYSLPNQPRPPGDYLDGVIEEGDPHLRAVHVVEGYEIVAKDDEFGHVADFIFDDESWAIRYLVIDTLRIWHGKKVLISPEWVTGISWSDRTITIALTKEKIRNSPEYRSTAPVNREYEEKLYDYYGRPAYWSEKLSNFGERKKLQRRSNN
jgi:stress response protein YsnF